MECHWKSRDSLSKMAEGHQAYLLLTYSNILVFENVPIWSSSAIPLSTVPIFYYIQCSGILERNYVKWFGTVSISRLILQTVVWWEMLYGGKKSPNPRWKRKLGSESKHCWCFLLSPSCLLLGFIPGSLSIM